jgi:subtilisin-like proprotein convertase family protein
MLHILIKISEKTSGLQTNGYALKFLFCCFIIFQSFTLKSQQCIGTGGAIYDDSLTIFSQTVSGLPNKLNPNYGLQSVSINLTHTYVQNLTIGLMSPNGTYVTLVRHKGGNTDYFTNTVFTDTASLVIQTISNSYTPYTGYFKPKDTLGNVNNYSNGNGLWKLYVYDDAINNTGSLVDWKLNFGTNALPILDTFSSNIPVIYINTHLQEISNDTFIHGSIRVMDNGTINRNRASDSNFQFVGNIKLKNRGHYSANFPQRSMSVELNDDNDNDTSISLLGMPAESDWVLMNTWNDRSLVRNPLMYHLFGNMGHYATRARYCEVFLDGKYWGIYQLTEKIKRDKERVDISKLKDTDIAGDSLTGGYIFKHDYTTDMSGWLSDVAPPLCPTNFARFQFVYPDSSAIKPEQLTYLRTYVDTIEDRLFKNTFTDSITGYRKFIDVNSFADYLICNEFSWNGDGFAKSMYFHKNRDSKDQKLYAGPVWDFDWSLKKMPWISDSIKVTSYTTSACNNLQSTLPWHDIMMKDEYFKNSTRCRYENFRNSILSQSYINHIIDSLDAITQEAQIRHYQKWPTWGQSTGTPETYYSHTMQEEIDTLKAMIGRRLTRMDLYLPGICAPLNIEQPQIEAAELSLYPNPANSFTYLSINNSKAQKINIELYNSIGQKMYEEKHDLQAGNTTLYLSTYHMSSGLYYVHINYDSHHKEIVKLCIVQ